MKVILALCGACALGCGLPKVALGGSVSLGAARGADAADRQTVRSALWLAMIYSAQARADERSLEPRARGVLDDEVAPCAIEIACTWEREAAYEASWGRSAALPQLDQEGEAWQ
jgi:hypothetical protein